jgi:hypothetical protein
VRLCLCGHLGAGLVFAGGLEEQELAAVLVHRGLVVHPVAHLVLQAVHVGAVQEGRQACERSALHMFISLCKWLDTVQQHHSPNTVALEIDKE